MIPALETERLVLRGLEPGDLDAYAAMYADAEVARHLEHGRPMDRAAAWRSMAIHLGHWQLRGYGQWALVERASGELVGRAGLFEPEGWPGLEVGWVLARPHWGRGFATEAGRAALVYAFEVVGAERVISLIRRENEPSIRVAERLGERYERTIDLLGGPAYVYGLARSAGP
ncbi:MAG TPA: GNAT family N-acetyltransferase [Solirubrobacteraceae bacterium]|jgi:RimJ/RimL family protein N-acetyltransferase|nr:GNAT family N-acetyltransferase [Solirubrobacteraceae bacterium]